MPRKFIEDEFTPVKRVGDNRYQLRDGRVVSRQRIEQMRHPERHQARAKRRYDAGPGKIAAQKWYAANREKMLAYNRARYQRLKAEKNQA